MPVRGDDRISSSIITLRTRVDMFQDRNTTESEVSPQEQNTSLQYFVYLLRQILLIEVILVVIAAFSFFFTGEIGWEAFSDRLFWMAMIPFGLGAFGILAVVSTGGTFNARRAFRPEQAKTLLDGNLELRRIMDKRYDFSIQMWVTGLICVGLSALVQIIGASFTR